jgi:hypothetical protein
MLFHFYIRKLSKPCYSHLKIKIETHFQGWGIKSIAISLGG